jgi:hypothetical protein
MLIDELYQRERRQDFLREAERDRELQAILKSGGKPFYKAALSAVGVRLVDLGNRLQDNVETTAPPPLVPASKNV